MGTTPLYQALLQQQESGRSRLHMPGHKGMLPSPLTEAASFDLTELPLTDSLYEADGCLRETERRFSRLYHTADSLLSAGGSTLCIQAMLAMAARGKKIICDRNLHISALNAMGLLDIEPIWVQGGFDCCGLPLPPTPAQVEKLLWEHPDACGVYLTSPNYYGYLADIAAIAEAVHQRDKVLLVDNAHGAHLPFVGVHPISQGADLCCDSLHKMLPALTGAALLHLGQRHIFTREEGKKCLSWFGSTSPSYLILLSADLLLGMLEDSLPAELHTCRQRVAALKDTARTHGCPPPMGKQDPLRLTLPLAGTGLHPQSARELLYRYGIEPELISSLAVVLLFAPGNAEEDWIRVNALLSMGWPFSKGQNSPSSSSSPLAALPLPRQGMPLREAMLSPGEHIPLGAALGRIAAGSVVPCPPGIPLVMCGEFLDAQTIFLLESYGIQELDVVK